MTIQDKIADLISNRCYSCDVKVRIIAEEILDLFPEIFQYFTTTAHDKNGVKIREGDILFNACVLKAHRKVIADKNGFLFLDNFESPIGSFSTNKFWEIIKED